MHDPASASCTAVGALGEIPGAVARATLPVIAALIANAVWTPALHAQDVRLTFVADSAVYAPSAEWYQREWDADVGRILEAMEAASGLRFPHLDVRVVVYLGISYTGTDSLPMHLNVRYPFGMTVVHELGHRLSGQIHSRPPEIDEHRLLYLWLYDAWVALYGQRFADAAVQAERGWDSQTPVPFFAPAWDWALSMTREQRASLLRALRAGNGDAPDD